MNRLARPADLELLAPLVAAFRDHICRQNPSDRNLAPSLLRLLDDPSTDFVLALTEDGKGEGFVQLRYRYSLWLGGVEAQLEDMFVLPASRGSGVGTALLHSAIGAAQARGCTRVGLTTNERNEAALRLYEKAGFSARRERWQGGKQLWLAFPPERS